MESLANATLVPSIAVPPPEKSNCTATWPTHTHRQGERKEGGKEARRQGGKEARRQRVMRTQNVWLSVLPLS